MPCKVKHTTCDLPAIGLQARHAHVAAARKAHFSDEQQEKGDLTEKPLSSRKLLRPVLLRRDASWYARGRNLYDGTSRAACAISATISLSCPRLNHMRLSLKMTGKSCAPPASKHLHALQIIVGRYML